MISGFDVQPSETPQQGYGINIIPRTDFTAIPDERLAHKNNRKRFTNVDDLGLPIFDKNGTRTFYTRNQGLSRLYLGRNLDLDSGIGDLSYSDSDGRVVVVSAEGTEGANSTLQQHLAKLNQQADAQKQEIDKRFAQAQEVLRGQ